MDNISSNPTLSYAQLYQQNLSRKPNAPSESPASSPTPGSVASVAPTESQTRLANDFSTMFGDDELAKLQRNLEAIAKLADTALRRFEA